MEILALSVGGNSNRYTDIKPKEEAACVHLLLSFLFFIDLLISLYMYECFVYTQAWAPRVHSRHRGQKRASDSLALALQTGVSHHVGVGT